MKKFLMVLMVLAIGAFLTAPVLAGDLDSRPALKQTINSFHEKQGEAVPQATFGYLFDLVTNAYSGGWGSVICLTNYNSMRRNIIQGILVPKGSWPGQELDINVGLEPYEVSYLSPQQLQLGDENAWMLIWSTIMDFGAGVLIYNTGAGGGMVWEGGWYFNQP
jgi:hypothetical protein